MANGKFSRPRPNREEEREIEQAFRQVTGQEPAPKKTVQAPSDSDPMELDLIFDEDILMEAPVPEPPAEEPKADFPGQAMAMLEQVVDFCDRNRKVLLVGLCAAALALILAFIGIFFVGGSDPYDKTILNNVLIADINVGGMTREEAVHTVKEATEQTYSRKDMVVDLAGTQLRLSAAEMNITLDVKAAVNAAYDYGRTGTKAEQEKAYLDSFTGNHIIGLLPYLEWEDAYIQAVLQDYAKTAGSALTQTSYGLTGRIPDLKDPDFDPDSEAPTLVIQLGTPGVHFDVDSVYEQILDTYSLHQFQISIEEVDTISQPDPLDLKAVYEEFCVEPVNATIDLRNFEVIPGTYGCLFDLDAAQSMLDQAIWGDELEIPMEYIAPTILDEDMFFQDTLAEQKSTYRGAVLEKNLQAACKALNGTVINPGEEFSFNNVVGERTSDKGYRYATDVTGLQETTTLGGGVSQVSSVLYYCTLVADLNVTSRTSHKLIPGYSDYGMDAMVGWKTPDFKFTNNTGFPIRIDAEASNGQIKMAIVGTDERDYHVAMDYEVISTKVPKVEYKDLKHDNKDGYKDGDVIREGVTGYSVKTYRLKYDNETGDLISRDFVANTNYQSISKIVARVKAPEETTEATEPEETKPEDTKPEETKPEETKPEETTPSEEPTKPAEPEQTQPQETEPKAEPPKETESAQTPEPPVTDPGKEVSDEDPVPEGTTSP